MDQRKLIRLGNSSFAIALPKGWVNKAGLKKGDDVFIVPNSNGELIVQPTLKKESNDAQSVILLEKKDDEEIARDIIAAYISGCKLIEVKGEKDRLKIAKGKAKKFLNLEPIEETSEKIIFKDLLDIEDISVEKFLRRMDNNLKEMFSGLLNMVNDGKKFNQAAGEIEEIDEDVTKFYFLVWRIVNLGINNPSFQSNLKISPKSFVLYFWLSYNLEQIGDELKRIARKIEAVQDKELLKKVLGEASECYNKSMKSFFDNNRISAKEVLLDKERIIQSCEKLAEIKNCEVISEKLKRIVSDVQNNSKIMFYNL